MCYEEGGTIDDLIIYNLADEKYIFVPNAANIDKDYEWINEHLKGDVTLKNISDEIGLLAIQDPKAEGILQKLTDINFSKIIFYHFAQDVTIAGINDILIPVQVTQGKMDSNFIQQLTRWQNYGINF